MSRGNGSRQRFPTMGVVRNAQVRRPDGLATGYRGHLAATARSARTRSEYARRVDEFMAWVARGRRRGVFADPERFALACSDYLVAMKRERGWTPATVNVTVAALSHFGRFAGLGSPAGLRERIPVRAPKALSEDEEAAVVGAARARGRRDAAVVALMAFCGLRVHEVAALSMGDVEGETVIIRAGKGGHYRKVPLPGAARVALDAWVRERPLGPGPLFPGAGGRPVSVRRLAQLVEACGDAVGIRLAPHTLRHTFATRLVRAGVDLVVVADLMGHAHIETTRAYTHPSDEDVAAAVELAVVDELAVAA